MEIGDSIIDTVNQKFMFLPETTKNSILLIWKPGVGLNDCIN